MAAQKTPQRAGATSAQTLRVKARPCPTSRQSAHPNLLSSITVAIRQGDTFSTSHSPHTKELPPGATGGHPREQNVKRRTERSACPGGASATRDPPLGRSTPSWNPDAHCCLGGHTCESS